VCYVVIYEHASLCLLRHLCVQLGNFGNFANISTVNDEAPTEDNKVCLFRVSNPSLKFLPGILRLTVDKIYQIVESPKGDPPFGAGFRYLRKGRHSTEW
jgi:hypothetical protein